MGRTDVNYLYRYSISASVIVYADFNIIYLKRKLTIFNIPLILQINLTVSEGGDVNMCYLFERRV